jgi:hypothetical protein
VKQLLASLLIPIIASVLFAQSTVLTKSTVLTGTTKLGAVNLSHQVTANLGDTGVNLASGYSSDGGNGLFIFWIPIITPANMTNPSWGTPNMHWLVVDSGTPAWGLALYSDSSGSPGTLLCSAYSGTVATANVWNALSFSGCGTPSSSTRYWLAEVTASNTQAFIRSFSVCAGSTSVYIASSGLGSFTSNASWPSSASTLSPASDTGDTCPPAYITINYTSTASFDVIDYEVTQYNQGTPTTIQFPTIQTGDALIVGTTTTTGVTISSVTDSISGTTEDTLSQAGTCASVTSGGEDCILYVVPATANVNEVAMTFAKGGGDYHNSDFVMEVKGLHGFDKAAYDTSYLSNTPPAVFTGATTATTTHANEFCVGVLINPYAYSTNMGGYFTGTSGWPTATTAIWSNINNWGVGLETVSAGFWETVSSTGNYGVTGTYTDGGTGGPPFNIATGTACLY